MEVKNDKGRAGEQTEGRNKEAVSSGKVKMLPTTMDARLLRAFAVQGLLEMMTMICGVGLHGIQY